MVHELLRQTQWMLFQWHGFLSVLIWGAVVMIAYNTFWGHVEQNDPIEVWNGNYEMRGRRRVKVGYGTLAAKER